MCIRDRSRQLAINGHDATDRKRIRPGRACSLSTFEELFYLRVLHDEPPPETRSLGCNTVNPEDLLRKQPPLEVRVVEEDEAERARAVVEDRLEDREAAAPRPDEPRRDCLLYTSDAADE